MTSCDYSPVVINKMKERCSEKMSMKCMVASEVSLVGDVEDIHHMSYPDESFDVVIDKGTLDAIICGDEATCFPDKVLLEVNRVLKKDGVYVWNAGEPYGLLPEVSAKVEDHTHSAS